MRNQKQKIIIITFIIICVIFLINIYLSVFHKPKNIFDCNNLVPHHQLEKLRETIGVEKEVHKNLKNCPVFGKMTGIVNHSGTCYLNVALQALTANENIVEPILITNFTPNEKYCMVLQFLFCKMLTSDSIYIDEEISFLNKISGKEKLFSMMGGSVNETYHFIIDRIIEEMKNINADLTSLSYKIQPIISVKCKNCLKSDKIGEHTFIGQLFVHIDHYKKQIDADYICEIFKISEEYHLCDCKRSFDVAYNLVLPKTIFIELLFPKDALKDQYTHSKIEIHETITIDNVAYELFAILLCIQDLKFADHGLVCIKKNGIWKIADDAMIVEKDIHEKAKVKTNCHSLWYKQIQT